VRSLSILFNFMFLFLDLSYKEFQKITHRNTIDQLPYFLLCRPY